MIQAVVLAAGLSSRAKVNKLGLEIGGVPILLRTVEALRAHCSQVVVVTGHYRDDVETMTRNMPGVVCVHNQAYLEGMFTSVQRGVQEMTGDFLLTPADYPLLTAKTIEQIIMSSGDIRVPSINGKGGHPIYISEKLIKPLLEEPRDSNLKVFRDRYEVTWVEVENPGILTDIDTMDDYQRVKTQNPPGDLGRMR